MDKNMDSTEQLNTSDITMKICVIPARGGSKRIPRKNIRSFQGKPIIAWSIQAAKDAGCFERIVVSTDDKEIAEIALQAGAEIPFLRPKQLADDHSGTREVIQHAIEALGLSNENHYKICCLYATAPFVRSEDIINALILLNKSRADSVVFAATTFPFPIQRALHIDSENYTSAFDANSVTKRSQDLKEMYHDAGQFYWASAHTWQKDLNLFDQGRALIIPRWRAQDIDTEEDWRHSELLHLVLKNALGQS